MNEVVTLQIAINIGYGVAVFFISGCRWHKFYRGNMEIRGDEVINKGGGSFLYGLIKESIILIVGQDGFW